MPTYPMEKLTIEKVVKSTKLVQKIIYDAIDGPNHHFDGDLFECGGGNTRSARQQIYDSWNLLTFFSDDEYHIKAFVEIYNERYGLE